MGKKMSDGKESRSVAPFLTKCYEMVDDNSTDSIISWGQNDNSFVIWDMTDFSVKLLPKYFKHSNSSSFIRQLNIYGFRKIEFDRWEFANDGFIRGQKQLLKTIARRKNSQGMDNRKSVEQQDNLVEDCEKVENEGLWKEVENLENDRNALMQELKKLRQHQEIADNNLLLLRNRIQGMEKNQQQMLSFLVMVMQNPSFLVQLLHPKENNWRVAEPGSIMEQGVDDSEPLASNGMIVRYQPSIDGMPKPAQIPATSPENPQEATSIGEMKDVFLSPDFVKVLMDDNFPSLENYAPFILPELSDDRAWEQLLLHTPFLENVEETDQHIEEPAIAENNMEPTVSGSQINGSQSFDSFIKEFENTGNSEGNSMDSEVRLENSQSMEMLSKRLGLLASENNHNDGVQ